MSARNLARWIRCDGRRGCGQEWREAQRPAEGTERVYKRCPRCGLTQVWTGYIAEQDAAGGAPPGAEALGRGAAPLPRPAPLPPRPVDTHRAEVPPAAPALAPPQPPRERLKPIKPAGASW